MTASGVVVCCPIQGLVVRKKHLPPFRNPVCNHLCHRQHLLVLMLKERRSDSGSHIWIGSSCSPPQTGQRNNSVRVVSESIPVLYSALPGPLPSQARSTGELLCEWGTNYALLPASLGQTTLMIYSQDNDVNFREHRF